MTKPNLKVISNKSSRLAEEIIMGRTPREITDRTLKPILSTLGMEITRFNTGSIREIKFRITNEEFLNGCLKRFNDLFVRPDVDVFKREYHSFTLLFVPSRDTARVQATYEELLLYPEDCVKYAMKQAQKTSKYNPTFTELYAHFVDVYEDRCKIRNAIKDKLLEETNG